MLVAPEFLQGKADIWDFLCFQSLESTAGADRDGCCSNLEWADRRWLTKWNSGGLPVVLRYLCQQAMDESRPSRAVMCFEESAFKKSGIFSGTLSTVLSYNSQKMR